MQIQMVKIGDLKPDPENPRTHSDQNIEAISESLSSHGQVEPLLVQKSTMMVIAGNGRMQAMKSLGWTTAHAVVLDVSNEEARALSIRMNRTGELAGWDDKVLAKHLAELQDWGSGENFGFSEDEMNNLLGSLDTEIVVEETQAEPEAVSDDAVNDSTPDQVTEEAAAVKDKVPAPMPAKPQKTVQIFLSEEQYEPFHLAVRKLARRHKTDNVTDTVFASVMQAAGLDVVDDLTRDLA